MSTFLQDSRLALRALRKNPGYAAVAILTLALGIGANSAMFSVVNGVLLRPLPYGEPERLVRIWETRDADAELGNISPADFLDWQVQNGVFEALAAATTTHRTISTKAGSERLRAGRATPDFFAVLGVPPQIGRTFRASDGNPEEDPVVVLSFGLWQNRFGGDDGVLGESLTVEGKSHVIVGVMPAHFRHPGAGAAEQPEIWQPLRLAPDWGRGGHWLKGYARLAPAVTLVEAQADMDVIVRRLAEQYPASNTGSAVVLEPLHESLVGPARKALMLLFGAVGLVLLIACANVANLLLTRSVGRRQEMAIRTAIGASRRRLVAQLLTESMVLAWLGGALGLLLGVWGNEMLLGLGGVALPPSQQIAIDLPVLLFTFATAFLTGLLFGLAPALVAFRVRLSDSLKDGLRSSGRAAGQKLRSLLVVAQIAVAVVLMTGAGLLLQSFGRLMGVGPGIEADGVAAIEVALPGWRYEEHEQIGGFYRELLEKVRALPGVTAAGAVNNLPFLWDSCDGFRLEDRPEPPPGTGPCAFNQLVTPGYFRAQGIPLLRGRAFGDRDNATAVPVIVVNETLSERFWPETGALGNRLTYNGIGREIVGVVGNVRREGLDTDAPPEMFIPHLQDAWDGQMFVTVRTSTGTAGPLAAALRRVVAEMDSEVPVGMVLEMDRLISQTVAAPRFRTLMLVLFAALAVALAAIGVYGTVAYSVSERTREIGLRMALGAPPSTVLRGVLLRGGRLAAAGLVLGVAGALAATRWIESLLYGVAATHGVTFISVPLAFCGVALLASYIPARRASRVDPTEALRYE